MPRIVSIKNAVLHAFKSGNGEGCSGTRRSERLRPCSVDRKINIGSAHVACLGSHRSSTSSVAMEKERVTHVEVREMAEWLVEAISDNDLQTAAYALKACLVVPWPRGICLSLSQEVLKRLCKEDRLDWDGPLAEFYQITCGYRNEERPEYAADVAFAGRWLLDSYKHLIKRDPLLSSSVHSNKVHDHCRAVLDGPEETFAEIQRRVIERRCRKPLDGDIERVRMFITAVERLSEWAKKEGIDAVAVLAAELNAQPERIRTGYVRLYDAIDTALRRYIEDDPTYNTPGYYDLARDLVAKLKIAPSSPDEKLIEAARQVLQLSGVKQRTDRTAEINEVLERLVSLTEGRNPNVDRADEVRQSEDTGRPCLVRTRRGKLPRPAVNNLTARKKKIESHR
jgi:hypothetical protein